MRVKREAAELYFYKNQTLSHICSQYHEYQSNVVALCFCLNGRCSFNRTESYFPALLFNTVTTVYHVFLMALQFDKPSR